jgi:hypothetical protein
MEIKPVLQPPNNETPEHFYLKQIAKIWLKVQQQCQYVANEIYIPGDRYEGREERSISDAAGVKKRHIKGPVYDYTVFNIEVKVSKSDYLTGYCTGGHYNWVMTPKGLLKPEELPVDIGIIEVDLDKCKIKQNVKYAKPVFCGLGTAKKPRKRMVEYGTALEVVDNICRRLTNQDVYNNPWVSFSE